MAQLTDEEFGAPAELNDAQFGAPSEMSDAEFGAPSDPVQDSIKLDPALSNPGSQNQSFDAFAATHPRPSDVTAARLAQNITTPDQQNLLGKFIAANRTPELPVSGPVGQVGDAVLSGIKPLADIIQTGRDIQQNNADTTAAMRATAKKFGLDPDTVAKLPGIPEQIARGAGNAIVDLALSFTSPLGLATLGMGALPETAQKTLSLAFAGQMLADAPDTANELLQEIAKPSGERDYKKIAQLTVGGAGQIGFGALAAVHALAEPPKPIAPIPNATPFSTPNADRIINQNEDQANAGGATSENAQANEASVPSQSVVTSMLADHQAAQDAVTSAVSSPDKPPIAGKDARLAGYAGKLPKRGYAYDPNSDIYHPVKIQPPTPNASEIQTGVEIPKLEVRPPVGQETPLRQQPQESATASPQELPAPEPVTQSVNAVGALPASNIVGNPNAKNLPDWARQEMLARGMDPSRQFSDIDIRNPSVIAAIQSDPTLEDAVANEIGKEGEKGSLRADWAEINSDIESGTSRPAALQKYLDEIQKIRAQSDVEQQQKNTAFAQTPNATAATLSPDEFKTQVARATYDQAVSAFQPNKKGQKPNDFATWYSRVGQSNHDSIIRDAMLHDAPVSAAAVDAYGIKPLSGYVKEGGQYVFKNEPQFPPTPKGEQVVTQTPAADFTRYNELVASLKGVKSFAEAEPIQREIEAIKNRNGGMVPKPSEPVALPPVPPELSKLPRHVFGNRYAIHFDTRPNPDERIASVLENGFRSGQTSSDIDNYTSEEVFGKHAAARGWARFAGIDKPGAIAYVIANKDLRPNTGGRIKPGAKPVAVVRLTRENQSVWDAIRESKPSEPPAASQPNAPTPAAAPAAGENLKPSGFAPPPMPAKFESLDDVAKYREAYKNTELNFYKSLGLTDADAAKMFRAGDSRSNLDTEKIEEKLTPENRSRLDAFSTGEGSEMYQWDRQYDPTELAHENDKKELARHTVQNLSRESLPSEFGDKLLHAVVSLRKLKENGGTWSDVARELDSHTTRNSSSQGDKAEFFKSLGDKIKAFASQQGIELAEGELARKSATKSSLRSQTVSSLRGTHFKSAPVIPITDKPMAAKGLTSYRYKGKFGWIMIGAKDLTDALNEANRSLEKKDAIVDNLQVWDGKQYKPITPTVKESVPVQPVEKSMEKEANPVIDQIVKKVGDADRVRMVVVERRMSIGDDGKQYGLGLPMGVNVVGHSEPYYVFQSVREGTTHGQRYNAREKAQAALDADTKRKEDSMRAELEKMTPDQIQSQADYWLAKKEEPTSTIVPQKVSGLAGKPTRQRKAPKSLMSADKISDFQVGRDRVERRGDGTYVVDGSGQYAPIRVADDHLTPEGANRIRNLPADKREIARRTTEQTPYLSPDGKAERLAVFDEQKPATPAKEVNPKVGEVFAREGDYEFALTRGGLPERPEMYGVGMRNVDSKGPFESGGYGYNMRPEAVIERWANKEVARGTEPTILHPKAQTIWDEEHSTFTKAATAKAEAERTKAEAAALEANRWAAYRAAVDGVKLPTGKRGEIEIPAKNKDGTAATLKISGTRYGDWIVQKDENKYVSEPYYVSHVKSGLKAGKFATLEQAKTFIKALTHSGAKTDFKTAEEFSANKPNAEKILQVARAHQPGGEVPDYFKSEATKVLPESSGAGSSQPVGGALVASKLAQVGDEVRWKTGAGDMARSTVSKIAQLPNDKEPMAYVDWFGPKYVPVSSLEIVRKSSRRIAEEKRAGMAEPPLEPPNEGGQVVEKPVEPVKPSPSLIENPKTDEDIAQNAIVKKEPLDAKFVDDNGYEQQLEEAGYKKVGEQWVPESFKSKADELASKLDVLKTGIKPGSGQLHVFGIAADLWDRAVSLVQSAINGGGSLIDALAKAFALIKSEHVGDLDEDAVKSKLEEDSRAPQNIGDFVKNAIALPDEESDVAYHQTASIPNLGTEYKPERISATREAIRQTRFDATGPITDAKVGEFYRHLQEFTDPSTRRNAMDSLMADVKAQTGDPTGELAPALLYAELRDFAARMLLRGDVTPLFKIRALSNEFATIGSEVTSAGARAMRALREGEGSALLKSLFDLTKARLKDEAKKLGVSDELYNQLVETLDKAGVDRKDLENTIATGKNTEGQTIEDILGTAKPDEVAKTKPKRVARAEQQLESDAEKSAQQITDDLQRKRGAEWLKPGTPRSRVDAVKEFVKNYLKGRLPEDPIKDPIDPEEDYQRPYTSSSNADIEARKIADELEKLGVTPGTAIVMAHELIQERETKFNNERIKQMKSAANSRNIKGLVESILSSPLRAQSDPAWMRETARRWFLENGLSPDQAARAVDLFDKQFRKAFAKAQEKIAAGIMKAGEPRTLAEIVKQIRGGIFDETKPGFEPFSAKVGLKGMPKADLEKLAELDEKLSKGLKSMPEIVMTTDHMLAILRRNKVPPSVMKTLAANYAISQLSGFKTITIHGFTGVLHLVHERALLTLSQWPTATNLAIAWRPLGWVARNFVDQLRFGFGAGHNYFPMRELEAGEDGLRQQWEQGAREFKSSDLKTRGVGLLRMFAGVQNFTMRFLNALNQANIIAIRDAQLVLFGSMAFREMGIDPKRITVVMDNLAILRQRAYEDAIDRGHSPLHARVIAHDIEHQYLAEFFGVTASDPAIGGPRSVVPDPELKADLLKGSKYEGLSLVGRLAKNVREEEEGGLISRYLGLHALIKITGQMSHTPEGRIGKIYMFGYVAVPTRMARFEAWNSVYGLLRLGINKFRDSRGWESWWKQSLATKQQRDYRLRMALASTAVQGLLLGGLAVGGASLLGRRSSADKDAGKDKFGWYVTGNGPANKDLRDAWSHMGFQPNSIILALGGKVHVAIPITRVGESIGHLLWGYSAADDYAWRKKEAEAHGKTDPNTGVYTPGKFNENAAVTAFQAIGNYASIIGERGPLQQILQMGRSNTSPQSALAAAAGKLLAPAVPFTGLQRSVRDMIVGQVDYSTPEAAFEANFPILGWTGSTQAINRLGDPLYDHSWYAKIAHTGLPIAVGTLDDTPNQQLYSAILNQGIAVPPLSRSRLEEKYGPLTQDQWNQFAKTTGADLKSNLLSNLPALQAATPEDARKMVSGAAGASDRQTASRMGLVSAKQPAPQSTPTRQPRRSNVRSLRPVSHRAVRLNHIGRMGGLRHRTASLRHHAHS